MPAVPAGEMAVLPLSTAPVSQACWLERVRHIQSR